jgi:streptogramin lyase
MRRKQTLALVTVLVIFCGSLIVMGFQAGPAESQRKVVLTGVVTSTEGPMEGVLVRAKKVGSPITIGVVTDHSGRYRFPDRLGLGQYSLSIRAVGYDLNGTATAEVNGSKTVTVDLAISKVDKAKLASQLSGVEWMNSAPGTWEEKTRYLKGCVSCHGLALTARSRHNADRWPAVLDRMSTYAPVSIVQRGQAHPADVLTARSIDRMGAAARRAAEARGEPLRGREPRSRQQAEYLASFNLSSGPEWKYELQALPRPKGKATQVLYTEYDLPRSTISPHDVIVVNGVAWYSSFGEQFLGRLDPNTGAVKEYPLPLVKADAPRGTLGLRADKDGNLWIGMLFQGSVAKFDVKKETFQVWTLPPNLMKPYSQLTETAPQWHHVDNKLWIIDSGEYSVKRLDLATGTWEMFQPFGDEPHYNIYDVITDPQNNVYFTNMGREHIGRIDAKTKEITLYQTPSLRSAPRRGMMDGQGRIWFGEFGLDQVGMFDTRTKQFREWPVPTRGTWPYDATIDRNGYVWTGGMHTDRVIRLDPRTSETIEYLLPRSAINIRRVFVDDDNPGTPAFWVGSNHGGAVFKLEPLDAMAPQTRAQR